VTLKSLILLGLLWSAPALGQEVLEPPIPALLEPSFLLSTARIVASEEFRGDGTILGAVREMAIRDQSLTASDQVFVPHPLRGQVLQIGDAIQFYRLERRINDPVTSERLGWLLIPTGIGNVDSLTGQVARARVTHAFHPILVGDYARAVLESDTLVAAFIPGVAPAEGHVVALQQEKAIVPPFDRFLVRTGEPGTLVPGEVVRIYRPGPVEAGRSLGDVVIGHAMVIRAEGDIAAVVLFDLIRSDLAPGDLFRRVPLHN
jgi:hypothetical protein